MGSFGRGSLAAPGAPQGSLQYGGAQGISASPTGASALRAEGKITEYLEGPGLAMSFGNGRRLPCYWTIAGTTRDSTGAVLGSCRVDLYEEPFNFIGSTVSDATDGSYSFTVANNGPHFVRVIDHAGVNPTLAGSSLTLTAV